MPTSAPTNPPTAPPTPRPASAAMIGPAAMNGPRPGIASAPMPASRPSVPPSAPPAATPVVVPSGALVFFSCAKSFVPCVIGHEHRDVVVREPFAHERVYAPLGLRETWINTECPNFLISHVNLLVREWHPVVQ